jgi:hypothetical protein
MTNEGIVASGMQERGASDLFSPILQEEKRKSFF